jgi:type VI secretion system protein ImpF
MTAEEYKDAVARDLEALLNTRSVYPENALGAYPECSNSLVTYGLTDFADRSLSSPGDRAYICECLEKTIERHEPRLREVKAILEVRDDMSVNRLRFSITALLVVSTSEEPVNFDALLQPSTLQYSISKAGRGSVAASAGG